MITSNALTFHSFYYSPAIYHLEYDVNEMLSGFKLPTKLLTIGFNSAFVGVFPPLRTGKKKN